MDTNSIFEFWIETSEVDYKVMNNLFRAGYYHWSLFIGHLVIEKLLKAVYVKRKNDNPPYTHDLNKLVQKAGIEITEEQIFQLDTITSFNISGRYDDYKRSFYNKCDKKYTTVWIKNIKLFRKWLKENYLK